MTLDLAPLRTEEALELAAGCMDVARGFGKAFGLVPFPGVETDLDITCKVG